MIRKHRQERTISRPVSVSGFGFWSGRDVQVRFTPARPHTGIVFVRTDYSSLVRIPARLRNRIESARRTTLSDGRVRVEMIEHVMAALAGLRIDNCEVHVNGEEMPGCDGSSRPFVEALWQAGVQVQNAWRRRIVVTDVMRVGTDEDWVEARPSLSGDFEVEYELDYGPASSIAASSYGTAVTPTTFREQLAPARTFLLDHEAETLRRQGIAKRVTPRDVLVFGKQGLIENCLRYDDECVRHKCLDIVGDLALTGCDLIGHFVGHRSGHRLNAALAQELLTENEVAHALRASA